MVLSILYESIKWQGVPWMHGIRRADDGDAFCIIEGRDTVLDFAKMDLQEIRDNITRRRNKIFLHMEEVLLLKFPSVMAPTVVLLCSTNINICICHSS